MSWRDRIANALRNTWAAKMLDDPEYGKLPHVVDRYKPIEYEWYHGTQAPDFSEFKWGGVPRQTKDWNTLLGPHFADKPGVSDMFASGHYTGKTEGGRIMPVQLGIGNPKLFNSETEMRDDAVRWALGKGLLTPADFMKTNERYTDIGKAVRESGTIPDWGYGFGGEVLREAGRKKKPLADAYRQGLTEAGHDGIIYRNDVEGIASHAAIPFAPSQIRSRWAAFDPATASSGNLLAGVAGLTAVPAGIGAMFDQSTYGERQ